MQYFQLQTKNFNETPKCWLLFIFAARQSSICNHAKHTFGPLNEWKYNLSSHLRFGNKYFCSDLLQLVDDLQGLYRHPVAWELLYFVEVSALILLSILLLLHWPFANIAWSCHYSVSLWGFLLSCFAPCCRFFSALKASWQIIGMTKDKKS